MKPRLHLRLHAAAIAVALGASPGFGQVSATQDNAVAAQQAYKNGLYSDAERLHLKAISEKTESEERSANVTVLLNNLAAVYVAEGKSTDAIALFK